MATARPPRARRQSLLDALSEPSARVSAVAFACGQLLDAATTRSALATQNFREANPLFAGVAEVHPNGLLLLKVLLAGLVLTVAAVAVPRHRLGAVLAVLAGISLEAPLMNGLRLLGVV